MICNRAQPLLISAALCLTDAACASETKTSADPQTIKATVRDVLSGPDYVTNSPDAFNKLRDWLVEIFRPFFKLLDSLYYTSPFLYFGIIAVLALILVFLAWHIAYTLVKAMKRRSRPEFLLNESVATISPEELEAQARAAFEHQENLLGIRALLQASLLRLELARNARLRRGTTNRQYLARYRSTDVYTPLEQLVAITESRWFGDVVCTAEDVERCQQAHRQIQRIINAGKISV